MKYLITSKKYYENFTVTELYQRITKQVEKYLKNKVVVLNPPHNFEYHLVCDEDIKEILLDVQNNGILLNNSLIPLQELLDLQQNTDDTIKQQINYHIAEIIDAITICNIYFENPEIVISNGYILKFNKQKVDYMRGCNKYAYIAYDEPNSGEGSRLYTTYLGDTAPGSLP